MQIQRKSYGSAALRIAGRLIFSFPCLLAADGIAALVVCGDLWYEENITRLNELEPDIVWWPVYTDYNYLEWNNTVKFEYAKQAGKINAPVFYVNSVCMDKPDNREIAKGGAALFDKSFIKEELPAGNEGVLIVEV